MPSACVKRLKPRGKKAIPYMSKYTPSVSVWISNVINT